MLYIGREDEKEMRRERRMMDMRNWVAIEDLGVLSFFLSFPGFLDSSFVVRRGGGEMVCLCLREGCG
jgi:hypothetical protein